MHTNTTGGQHDRRAMASLPGGAYPLPRGPVEPSGGMHGLDGKPAARCYTCSWTQPADNRGDALLLISRHLNEEHDGGRIDIREPGTLLANKRMPVRNRAITLQGVHETLRGHFDGMPEEDAETILSILSVVYPEGASLSAYEATEALLRAGFSRGRR